MKCATSLITISLIIAVSNGFSPASSLLPTCYRIPQSTRCKTRANMFTGIVEEMGTVISLEERDDMTLWDGTSGKGTELTVRGNVVLDGAYLG
jgi:hypothetical protein